MPLVTRGYLHSGTSRNALDTITQMHGTTILRSLKIYVQTSLEYLSHPTPFTCHHFVHGLYMAATPRLLHPLSISLVKSVTILYSIPPLEKTVCQMFLLLLLNRWPDLKSRIGESAVLSMHQPQLTRYTGLLLFLWTCAQITALPSGGHARGEQWQVQPCRSGESLCLMIVVVVMVVMVLVVVVVFVALNVPRRRALSRLFHELHLLYSLELLLVSVVPPVSVQARRAHQRGRVARRPAFCSWGIQRWLNRANLSLSSHVLIHSCPLLDLNNPCNSTFIQFWNPMCFFYSLRVVHFCRSGIAVWHVLSWSRLVHVQFVLGQSLQFLRVVWPWPVVALMASRPWPRVVVFLGIWGCIQPWSKEKHTQFNLLPACSWESVQ